MLSLSNLEKTLVLLVIIGGLNWGLVGLFGFDLVMYIANLISLPIVARIIYVIVGACSVWALVKLFKK